MKTIPPTISKGGMISQANTKNLMYDFINLGKKNVNWACYLSFYKRTLNGESKYEELGWKWLFEVCFRRKLHILAKESLEEAGVDMKDCIIKVPATKGYQHQRSVKQMRKRALLYSKRTNKKMAKRSVRLHNTSASKQGDEVRRYRPDRRGTRFPERIESPLGSVSRVTFWSFI